MPLGSKLATPRGSSYKMGKMMSPLVSAILDRILFIFAGNDNVHESLDVFEIQPDPTSGFHGNRYGYDGKKRCLHFFSAVFPLILFILACNDDMHESWDEFEFHPDWSTDCGISCPRTSEKIPIGL